MLAQVQHVYHPATIPVHPYPSIRLANLLANEEIACTRVVHTVSGTLRDYLQFVQTQLQGCLAGILVTSVSFFLSFRSQFTSHPASLIFFVSTFPKISACCTYRLHHLKKMKAFLLAKLMALLFLSWRHILIFPHKNMM